ncbi:MAG TPA: FAD:protein FMN transferase [Candidatus Dormibacteraeota bacterium]|nr:FAD:protein FMN transferase [Candidatus Dormibacteraeota bacterium]
MGTTCSLFARDADLAAAELWVRRTAERLTRFAPDSELSQLNGHVGEWRKVSAELESVLRASLDAYAMSGGLVNAAVLPAMTAIGYTRPLAQGAGVATLDRAGPLPPLPVVLEVRQGEARAMCGIDLGGIAKGWMADRLAEMLGADCLVNLGGDLRTIGEWPVEVAGTTLLLRDQAAATSSTRKRRWGDVHHLIDPRTGLPAQTGLSEVSVVTSTAFEAEVVAKTALLLGPALAPAYCAGNALAWWLGR